MYTHMFFVLLSGEPTCPECYAETFHGEPH